MTSELTSICLADPQPGDFCCIPISGSVGLGIELGEFLAAKLQRQPAELKAYDHAEIYAGEADGLAPYGYTYSAYPRSGRQGGTSGKRALPCPPAQLPGSVWSSGLYDLTTFERFAILDWCKEHASVGYSFLDYAAIATHALGIPAPWLKRYIASSGRLICSQYVDMAFSQGGAHLFQDGRWPGYVTPWDLACLLLQLLAQRESTSW